MNTFVQHKVNEKTFFLLYNQYYSYNRTQICNVRLSQNNILEENSVKKNKLTNPLFGSIFFIRKKLSFCVCNATVIQMSYEFSVQLLLRENKEDNFFVGRIIVLISKSL